MTGDTVVAMATPTVVLIVLLLLVCMTSQAQMAQECRVYQLNGGNDHYATPVMAIHNLFTVSFYNRNINDVPINTHILLAGSTRNASVFINGSGDVSLRLDDTPRGRTFKFKPAHLANTWLSLAILIQDQNILIYRTDERDSMISVETNLGTNLTARVTTSQPKLFVHLNCPAGCLMHDKRSPLIDHDIPLEEEGVNIYMSHKEGAQKATLTLSFKNRKKNRDRNRDRQTHKFQVDITRWKASHWHKVIVVHNQMKHITVSRSNGSQIAKMNMRPENASFAIESSTSMLWSLHCYPDHATGLESWLIPPDFNNTLVPEMEDVGAGKGEVLAWVLAGIALFLVMVMALLLCTKMGPGTESLGYGASVGVVTSFHGQVHLSDPVREAEEDTEPDSPTFTAPVIPLKVPEEEDEHQSNTKML